MKCASFVLPLLLCLCLPGYAQEESFVIDTVGVESDMEGVSGDEHALRSPEKLETTAAYASKELKVTRFDDKKWKTIVKDVNYNEQKEEDSTKNEDKEASAPWSGKLLKTVSFVVIAALLITVIYYVTRVISFDAKIERSAFENGDLEAPVEDIAQLDIAKLLEQAKREGSYKLAVRLYYLELLKKLNDKGAIIWKKDKTNRDYLNELLTKNRFFNEVRRLTLSYEAVWYGDHDLTPETFQFLTTQFESIYGKISTTEA